MSLINSSILRSCKGFLWYESKSCIYKVVKNCRHELTIDFATEEKFSAWCVFGVARWGVYKKKSFSLLLPFIILVLLYNIFVDDDILLILYLLLLL